MNNNLRIVFADCEADLWIRPVTGDICKACEKLGWEVFVIGHGNNIFVDARNYINVKNRGFNYLANKFSLATNIDLERLSVLIKRKLKSIRQQSENNERNKKALQKIFSRWFVEVITVYKMVQPDLVIVWNGLVDKRGVYAEAARSLNIPIYYAEKGMLPDSWYVDSEGINFLSTISREGFSPNISQEEIKQWEDKLEKIDKEGKSAWKQPEFKKTATIRKDFAIPDNKKIIFFPGQVDHDSNIVVFSPYFRNTLNALKWLIDNLASEEFFILSKPHPRGSLTMKDLQKVLGNKGKAVSDINIINAIEIADCVVSINSTVAFEAAIRAKPVLLLGQGVLSNKDFISNYVPGKSAYSQVVECIERYNENKDYLYNQAISFAAYLDSKYYTYKGNVSKTLQILKGVTGKGNKSSKKTFTAAEIMSIFSQTTYKDVLQLFIKPFLHNLFNKNRALLTLKTALKFILPQRLLVVLKWALKWRK